MRGLNDQSTPFGGDKMRKALMAMAAVSLAIPASMAVPTDGANARRHYEYHEWRGRDGRMYRSEAHTSELQSLMRTSYADIRLNTPTITTSVYIIHTTHLQ